jgi:hypothetical protein
MDNLAAYALVLYLEDGQSYRDGYNPFTVTKCEDLAHSLRHEVGEVVLSDGRRFVVRHAECVLEQVKRATPKDGPKVGLQE